MSYYIYKICCDDCPDFVYVGSTVAFRQRKSNHKADCNNENCKKYNNKLYTTIRENGGWDNWRMVIIEECGEITLTEARIKEEENRVKLNANLNSQKCHQTEEEYYERHRKQAKEWSKNNIERVKENTKQYRDKNKKKIMEWKSQKITCECGRTFRIDGKAEHERSNIHKKLMQEINKN